MRNKNKRWNILFYIVLVFVLFTACSGKEEGAPVNSAINPIDDVSPDNNKPTDLIGEGSSTVESGILPEYNIQSPVTKKMIAIDAGHQSKANSGKEPIGPGSKTMKAKVSSGTRGISSGVAEYKLNLVIAKKLKDELINRGYTVYMIRETNDVNLSNRERADMADESGADIFIRIHADGSTDQKTSGVSTLYPSSDNPYVPELSDDSLTLSKDIVDSICKSTGAKNRGAVARDDMSGINWSTIPVSIIEMGFMSNPKEDKLMQTKAYQKKIVKGICDGIDTYFEDEND